MVDMPSNLLNAIDNLSKCKNFDLAKTKGYVSNVVSEQGNPLEKFVRASFCGIPDTKRNNMSSDDVFCFQGQKNHPPDAMLRNAGDAIEIKKVEGISTIHLNSSLPKQRLYDDDKMITNKAVECEEWKSRDMLYVIGHIKKDTSPVRSLFFFYGDCIFKRNEYYNDIFESAKNSLKGIDKIQQTGNEYGTIKDVDELGINTDMRLRPLNSFDHPFKIFSEIVQPDKNAVFSLFAVMRRSKFESFPDHAQHLLTDNPAIERTTKQIRDPDNPGGEIRVEVFSFTKT